MRTKVSIVKGIRNPSEEEISSMVRSAIKLIGGLNKRISPNDIVLIKPNLVYPREPSSGVTTDPLVCKAIADMVREVGATPIIAESSTFGVDTEYTFEVAGYNQLRDQGYEVTNLKKVRTKKVKVTIPGGISLKEIYLPELVMTADQIISIPKMKTHDQASATLTLKNMMGVLPDVYKRKFHKKFGVFQSVVDLCSVLKPGLAVVDGIICQEGLGPIFGTPIERNLIIAGTDLVAVDTIASLVMGFPPEKIELTKMAAELDLGIMNLDEIDVVGEQIQDVQHRFKRVDEAVNELIQIPEGLKLVANENQCSGCKNTVYSVLFDLNNEGTLDKAKGLHFVVGETETLPKTDKNNLVFVGECTAEFNQYGRWVPGCPPNNKDVKIEIRDPSQ